MVSKPTTRRKVVAIIQARMGSTRFPGKVLALLNGRPVLEWVVDAVKSVKGVDDIVVATTTKTEDKAIGNWCATNDVDCFLGDPVDVLNRYAECAKEYQATHILRITADCPLIDAETVSSVLEEGLRMGADYFGLAGDFPDGFDCEGFRVEALFLADAEATLPSDREHVTPYMKKNPLSISFFPVELWSGLSEVRLTIDEPADLIYLEKLLADSPMNGARPSTDWILKTAKNRRDLRQIVAHIQRNEGYAKSLSAD